MLSFKKGEDMLQAASELDRAAYEIKKLRLLVREIAMRCQIAFPESEEDEKWFNEQCDHKKSGDFMLRLLEEIF